MSLKITTHSNHNYNQFQICLVMPKRKLSDEAAEKNRNRVRECRLRKKIKVNYNEKVQERLKSISSQQIKSVNNHHDENTEKSPEKNCGFDAIGFQDRLRKWASNYNISGEALNGLLKILIWAGFTFLPKDSRTLKKTPPKVPIDILTNGKLFYYGISKCLVKVLATAQEYLDTIITLNFNFDGFPISNSSASQFWPILASIKGT